MGGIHFVNSLNSALNKHDRTLRRVCHCPILVMSTMYSGILGLVGMILSFWDIIRIIQAGPTLPCSMVRPRTRHGFFVSPEVERDLKLVSLVLSFEYYLLLVVGTFTGNPFVLIPWMILYFFIILIEFLIFVLRIFMDGIVLKKQALLMTMFIVFNWLSIFCQFHKLMGH